MKQISKEAKTPRIFVSWGLSIQILLATILLAGCDDGRERLTVPINGAQVSVTHAMRELSAEHVPYLIEGLKSDDPDIVEDALRGINHLGRTAKDAVPALIDTLDWESENIKDDTTRALGKMGKKSADAVPKLHQQLQDRSISVHLAETTIETLGRIGPTAEEALPTIQGLAESDSHFIRIQAAYAMGTIGFRDKDVIPTLIQLLKDEEPRVVANAAEALANINLEPEKCIDALIPLLQHEELEIHRAAVFALSTFAPDSDRVFEEYERYYFSDSSIAGPPKGSIIAAVMRTNYYTDRGLPILIHHLRTHRASSASRGALHALSDMGANAQEAIPLLLELHNEADARDKPLIAHVLASICDDRNEHVIRALLLQLGMKEDEINHALLSEEMLSKSLERYASRQHWRDWFPDRHHMQQILSRIMRIYEFHNHAYIHFMQAEVYGLGYRARGEIAIAIRELSDEPFNQIELHTNIIEVQHDSYLVPPSTNLKFNYDIPQELISRIRTLEEMRPAPNEVTFVLEELAQDCDWDVRKAAEHALSKISAPQEAAIQ